MIKDRIYFLLGVITFDLIDYIYIIIRDNETYEGFRVFDYL